MPKIIRLPEVIQRVCLSKATIYRLIKSEDFPQPLQLGCRSVAWRVDDISTWLDSRPRGVR